ncbi:DUF3054 domain-containing protein [Arthrobacter sp. 260]|uniref:DUF3054 domain-containing protein n=1 Tax=Arthrobacter sp. 260 TaxID=2735314 RepID=UPI0014909C57|nr:DUF3054 domain-containing protein [Arthrobacter sp. 260]NOJ59639.1 DUF3054 domain-containing protein [Arthrobacter sp. 260]
MTPSQDLPSTTRPAVTGGRAAGWLLADLALVVAFAATGRSTHESGLAILGILSTAGPFLAACLLTWVVLRAWRSPAAPWPTGVLVWLGTAVGGLALRALFGGGMAVSFLVVAVVVLGVVLLLPRTVATLVLRRRATSR